MVPASSRGPAPHRSLESGRPEAAGAGAKPPLQALLQRWDAGLRTWCTSRPFPAAAELVFCPAPGRDKNIPAGLQSMNQAPQRRFAKGVQYKMETVIPGDWNTSKMALWHHLQGRPFMEEAVLSTQESKVPPGRPW
ncbi:hypothetical protein P7K49_000717 [Saguinus oedipus]|uniref:Uncharacterized protein n=1 Tax=Saguinus oedipus TaxID=9490 RepID=A0ABQ9WDF0_SAGOE|nr:hypothetical protein P7K49_000717 [Saguinus oedipus]